MKTGSVVRHVGTIKLLWKGEINNQAQYTCPSERNKIINRWRDLYGKEFEKCELQIAPDIYEKLSGTDSGCKADG